MRIFVKIILIAALAFCVFAINSSAEEEMRFDISASGSDAVIAVLNERDGAYELFISGSGRMIEFESVQNLPWSEYADRVLSVIVGEDVENLPYAVFANCSRVEVRNPYASIEIGVRNRAEFFGHRISTLDMYVNDFSYLTISYICKFVDCRCEICGYVCDDHGGGTPTCTDDALCAVCSYPYESYLGHDMNDAVAEVAATCFDDGTLAYSTCKRCRNYFLLDGTPVSRDELKIKAGHKFGDLIEASDPTCDEPGVVAHYTCSECGLKLDENGKEIIVTVKPMLEHSFETAPSCKSSATCTECGKTVSDLNNHEFVKYSFDESGHTAICFCGSLETNPEEHEFASEITKEATETEEGEILYTCMCGYFKNAKIPRVEVNGPPNDNGQNTEQSTPENSATDNSNTGVGNTNADTDEDDENSVGLIIIISSSVLIGFSVISLVIIALIRRKK